jgi:hypothetical protein
MLDVRRCFMGVSVSSPEVAGSVAGDDACGPRDARERPIEGADAEGLLSPLEAPGEPRIVECPWKVELSSVEKSPGELAAVVAYAWSEVARGDGAGANAVGLNESRALVDIDGPFGDEASLAGADFRFDDDVDERRL